MSWPNRFNELTPGEQASITRLVNHLASLPIDGRKMQITVGPALTADDLGVLSGEAI